MNKNIIKSILAFSLFSFYPETNVTAAEDIKSSLPSVLQQKVDSARSLLSRVPVGTTKADLAGVYGKIGMYYQAGNLPEIAILNYAHAFELNENEPKWAYLLAYLLKHQGKNKESYALYRKAFEKNENYVPTLLRIAQVSLEEQDYDEAKRLYERLSKISKFEAVAAEGLGQIALRQNDLDNSINYFKTVLKLQPKANRNYYFLAQAYKKKGERTLAKESLQKRGEVSAGYPDPLLNYVKSLYATGQQFLEKGIQQVKSGQYKQALELFHQGIELEPENMTLKTALGRALEYLGKSDQAEYIYKEVIGAQENNTIALFNLGALNDARGNTDIAREYYSKTLQVQSDNLDALSLLSSMEYRLGNFKKAIVAFNNMLTINPNLYDARVYLGLSYLADNDCNTGSGVLWNALKLKPSDGNVALVLSVAESQCKKNDKAWSLASKVYDASPGFKSARFAALVAGYLGKYQDALELQRHAMFEALKQGGLSQYPDLQVNLQHYSNGKRPVWSWKSYSREVSPLPPIRTAE